MAYVSQQSISNSYLGSVITTEMIKVKIRYHLSARLISRHVNRERAHLNFAYLLFHNIVVFPLKNWRKSDAVDESRADNKEFLKSLRLE